MKLNNLLALCLGFAALVITSATIGGGANVGAATGGGAAVGAATGGAAAYKAQPTHAANNSVHFKSATCSQSSGERSGCFG